MVSRSPARRRSERIYHEVDLGWGRRKAEEEYELEWILELKIRERGLVDLE